MRKQPVNSYSPHLPQGASLPDSTGVDVPIDLPISVHKAVGGESDFPCPGEILAAALASCLDTAIRMIANLMKMELKNLEVKVSLGADVRGTLMMNDQIPVGFQSVHVEVDIKTSSDVPDKSLAVLLNAAEKSCVILQTLRNPPKLLVSRTVNQALECPELK
ncbi:OsmC family protein [Pseudovibrio sp. POLY-S9]|uniref:OsmC family protein n=1 Tax=Pseudovibrio sp. POLY-S9 TaxID=1576596 RepID=UPI00070A0D6D|nr:OsmC family protein [Pseudovibrio sp. POLY-S9]